MQLSDRLPYQIICDLLLPAQRQIRVLFRYQMLKQPKMSHK